MLECCLMFKVFFKPCAWDLKLFVKTTWKWERSESHVEATNNGWPGSKKLTTLCFPCTNYRTYHHLNIQEGVRSSCPAWQNIGEAITVLPRPGQVSKQPLQALMKCPVMMSASVALQLTWDLPHSLQLLAGQNFEKERLEVGHNKPLHWLLLLLILTFPKFAF